MLFGMALRQTTGFVESLLRLVGLDWDVPDFSTLSRRQKTLAVNIPHRGSQGPLHLLIDTTGIKVPSRPHPSDAPAGQRREKESGQRRVSKQSGGLFARRWRKHGGPKRRVWRKIHSRCPAGEWNIRREGGSTRKHWRFGRSRSPAAISATRPCCPNYWPRSPPIRTSPVSRPPLTVCQQTVAGQRTAPATPENAMTPLPNAGLPQSSRPARTQSRGRRLPQALSRATKHCGHQNTLAVRSGDPSRPHPLDAPAGQWMERIPPPKPRRDVRRIRKRSGGSFSRRSDALCEPKVREAKLLGQRLPLMV